MTEIPERGPAVDPAEDLYRAIFIDWWDAENQAIKPGRAFNFPFFSTDIASLTSPEKMLTRFSAGTGLAQFNCGEARECNFDARQEKDPDFPENDAHANVYALRKNKKRKLDAIKLAETLCEMIQVPSAE